MAGYSRQSIIQDGETIFDHLFNNEYDALVAAFALSTGHRHDGSGTEGGYVPVISNATGDTQVRVSELTGEIFFDVEVASVLERQLTLSNGLLIPEEDGTFDLGSPSAQFNNLYLAGTMTGNVAGDITGDVSGNAGTATALETPRTISATGDISWTSAPFDGTANVSGVSTLSNTGVTPGTYQGITVDSKGRITSASDINLGTAAFEDVTTSPTDTTAGRITKVGDYGWGGLAQSVPGNDLNNALDTAIWRSTTGTLNTPPGFQFGSVLTQRRLEDGTGSQIFVSSLGSNPDNPGMAVRARAGTTFGDWVTVPFLEASQTFTGNNTFSGTNSFIGNTTDFTRISIGTNLEASTTDISLTSNSVIGTNGRISFVSEGTGGELFRFFTGSPDSSGGIAGADKIAAILGDGVVYSPAFLPFDSTPADYDDFAEYNNGIRMSTFASGPKPNGASNLGVVVSLATNSNRGMQLIASNVSGNGLLQWRPVHTTHPSGMGPSVRIHDDNSFASIANLQAGSGNNPVSSSDIYDFNAPEASSGSGTWSPNMNAARVFQRTLTGNSTLGNPSNNTAGQSGLIYIIQDGTGGRSLSYGGQWKTLGGVDPVIDTSPNAVNVFSYYVRAANNVSLRYLGAES